MSNTIKNELEKIKNMCSVGVDWAAIQSDSDYYPLIDGANNDFKELFEEINSRIDFVLKIYEISVKKSL